MKYTEEMVRYIENNITGISYKVLTEQFNERFGMNITVQAMRSLARRKELTNGINGQFQKGNTPHNKGCKGKCYQGCEKTWFKKGNKPPQFQGIWTEKETKEGYIKIKIDNKNTWKLKHRYVWEKEHGKIPSNHAIIFLDGDKTNCNIENLKLVSRSELCIMNKNKLLTDSPEINNTVTVLVKLMDTKNKKRKSENG